MSSTVFRIMRWRPEMDGPWSPEAARRFGDGGYNGLSLGRDASWTPRGLSFLKDLDDLRSFSFRGKVQDDVDAFRIESLEELSLLTGSRRIIPTSVQAKLSRLYVTNRQGIFVRRNWPNLTFLRVDNWQSTDLEIVSGATSLVEIDLGGRRQQGRLDGVQQCEALEVLRIINYSVLSTAPLQDLRALTEVHLMAAKPTLAHAPLDISNLRSPRLSKLWIMNADQLLNLESLAERPVLREVRLVDCMLSKDDLGALSGLPSWVKVEVI